MPENTADLVRLVDISLCPTDLEYPNGDIYDADKLTAAIAKFVAAKHPVAEISVKVGHRQGESWAEVDGDADLGADLVVAFFDRHGSDEDLFVEPDDTDQTIEIEANESAELLSLSLDDFPDDEPYRSECVEAWWDAFYAEVGCDDRLSGVEFVHPRGNRLMLPQWNGTRFAWRRAVLGSFSVPTQEQQDAIDAANSVADAAAAKAWSEIQAELAATADNVVQPDDD